MLSVGLVVMGPLAGDIEPRYRRPYYMFRTPLSQMCATMKGGVGGHITDLELSTGAFRIHFIHHQDHAIKWGPMGHIGVYPYLGSSTMYYLIVLVSGGGSVGVTQNPSMVRALC